MKFTSAYFKKIMRPNEGGSADSPSSYTPVRSTAEAGLTLNWLGSFRSGYEKAGHWVHGRWVVTPGTA